MEQTKFSITEVARLVGISRTSMYRNYIKKGVISVVKNDKDVHIDLSEVLRVFPNIKLEDKKSTSDVPVETQVNIQVDSLERENNMLKDQLKQSHEREQWLKDHIKDLSHQQTFLLEDKSKEKKRKKFLGIF